MKKIIGSATIAVATLLFAGCGQSSTYNSAPTAPTPVDQSNKNTTPTSGSTNSSPSQSGSNETQGSTINISGFAFNPGTLTVKKGTKVTWTNKDSAAHTIKSDTFNSGDIAQGGTFQFTFNNAGTFNYTCGIHPSMMGKIIVQ